MQSPGSVREHIQNLILASLNGRSSMKCSQRLTISSPTQHFSPLQNRNTSTRGSFDLRPSVCSNLQFEEKNQDQDTGGMESQSHGSTLQSIFSYSNLVHAVSGAAGSVVAISVFYPLDTVRTRLQVDDHRDAKNTFQVCRDIFNEEGLKGLYLGWFPVVTALCCSNFIYFYTFNGLKASINKGRKSSSPLIDLSLGYLSDTQIIGLMFFVSGSTLHVARESAGLFRGWSSMASTMFASSFVYFYAYTSLKYFCLLMLGDVGPLGMIARDLIIAFLAGIVNVLVTTPLWVANTRLKLQGAKLHTSHYREGKDKKQYNGIVDCILKIIQREGVQKLWGGTVPSLFLASNPAIQFMIYEALKRYFKKALRVQDLSALMYFLIGAIAKAIATVITYPLQVIQSRLRAGYAKHESTQTLKENLLNMVRTRGLRSLYKGLEAKLLQTVLTAALMFLTYEKIAAFIFRVMRMK